MSFVSSVKEILKLAMPIILGQIGILGIVLVDTAMVARVNANSVAALGISLNFLFLVISFGTGFLLAADSYIAFAVGEKKPEEAQFWALQNFYLTIGVALLGFIFLQLVSFFLPSFALKPEVIRLVQKFIDPLSLSLIPFFLFFCLRQYLANFSLAFYTMIVIYITFLLNIGLNWAFIFGHWGVSPLGLEGAGWARVITRILMFLALLPLALNIFRTHRGQWRGPDWASMKEISKKGVVIGLQNIVRSAFFSFLILMVSQLGTEVLAAHTVAIHLSSFLFMIPLGLTLALTILCGQDYGRSDWGKLQKRLHHGLVIGFCVGGGIALVVLVFSRQIFELLAADAKIVKIAQSLTLIIGLTFINDCCQSVLAGVLRGLKIVLPTLFYVGIGLWGPGFAISYWAIDSDQSLSWVWSGPMIGSFITTLCLWKIWQKRFRSSI